MNSQNQVRNLLQLPRELREHPEVVDSIRNLIEDDEDALRYYVRWMHFESALNWTLLHAPPDQLLIVSEIRRQVNRRRRWRYGSVALLLLLILAFQSVRLLLLPATNDVRTVGEFTASAGTIWKDQRTGLQGPLTTGERLSLLRGSFRCQMGSGAVVAGTGPAEVEFVDDWEIRVHSGSLCVLVPEEAYGFRTNTSAARIVDLGTLFGVRVNSEGETEVHVLEGRVAVRSGRVPALEIRAGISHKIAADGQIGPADLAAATEFSQHLTSLAGIVSVSGRVDVALPPPPSVKPAALVTAGTVVVFREQSKLACPTPVSLYSAPPGNFSSQQTPEMLELPAGTTVTTYILHAENSTELPAEGMVTFDGQILGFALTRDQLNATDGQFGHHQVEYPTLGPPKSRGTLVNESGDELEVSADGKTLRVKMSCSVGAFDQLRVFVAVPGSKPVNESF